MDVRTEVRVGILPCSKSLPKKGGEEVAGEEKEEEEEGQKEEDSGSDQRFRHYQAVS